MASPVGVKVDTRGVRDMAGRFARASANARKVLHEEGKSYVERLGRAVQAEAPARTGALRRSVRTHVEMNGARVHGTIAITAPYARPVIEGSRPHIIRARGGRVLAFQRGGKAIFARVVRHPGTKPNPFPARALRRYPPGPAVRKVVGRITTQLTSGSG